MCEHRRHFKKGHLPRLPPPRLCRTKSARYCTQVAARDPLHTRPIPAAPCWCRQSVLHDDKENDSHPPQPQPCPHEQFPVWFIVPPAPCPSRRLPCYRLFLPYAGPHLGGAKRRLLLPARPYNVPFSLLLHERDCVVKTNEACPHLLQHTCEASLFLRRPPPNAQLTLV